MGVSEDINWLKNDEEGVGKVFLLVVREGRPREVRRLFGEEDWWPVKSHLRALIDRGLVAEAEGSFELTESGKKVLEGFKAIEPLPKIV